jgi:hypothetical protein
MYIKIKKVKTEFSILFRYGAASLGDWGPKILEKHGGLICWGQNWTFSLLMMGVACCLEKYGTIHPVMWCHIPEIWSTQLICCESLKTHK